MAEGNRVVTVGVDTHKDAHVAAALDASGALLGTASFPADARGYASMVAWMRAFGRVEAAGVEGTGGYGAGLARALAMDPEIVFFDEPSAGLDPVSAALLDELILELKENMGMTVVVVTHDLDSIFTIGNNSVFLDAATHTMITGGDPHVLRCDQAHPDIVRFLNRGKTDSCPTSSKGYRS